MRLLSLLVATVLTSCMNENIKVFPQIDAKHYAELNIICHFGCEGWSGFVPTQNEHSSSHKKTIRLEGESVRELTALRLESRCATTPEIFVEIKTDTGFEQSWSIAKNNETQLPTGMCTNGRTAREHKKFIAFFKKHIMVSK